LICSAGLSLRRLAWGAFAGFFGTVTCSDSLWSPSDFVSLRRVGSLYVEARGPLRFPGSLALHAVVPRPRRASSAPVSCSPRSCCLPRCLSRVGPYQFPFFGVDYLRPDSSLSTLRSHGYPCSAQDSLPGGDLPFPGWITHEAASRGFGHQLIRRPPRQSFL